MRKHNDTELLIRTHPSSSASHKYVSVDSDSDEERWDDESLQNSGHLPPNFSPWPHVFNLANCIVGVSVLAMPYCFKQCGILLAVLMVFGCSILTKVTCVFLIQISFMLKRRSYEALALIAFGGPGRRLVELSLLFFLVSSIIAFMVVIGDIGPHCVADYLDLEAPTQKLRTLVMVLVTLFIIFPMSLIKDLAKLSVFSSLAIVFYVIFVGRIVLEAMPVIWEGKWSVHVVWWRSEGFLTCLPIVCMAMSCQTQLFCVLESIEDATPRAVHTVISHSINFCSSMYAAVGLFGYVAFYDTDLHGDVLVELNSSFFTQMMKLSFMLSIAMSIPLMLFPARSALFNLVRPKGCEVPSAAIEKSTFHILTSVLIVSNLMIALLIPNVEFVLGLTGSLVGSLVTIIIPSAMFVAIASGKTRYSVGTAKLCMVIGCFILLASTWATLRVEQTSNVVEKPMPKDPAVDKPALRSLEKLEERVLDSQKNISAKLDSIAGMAARGNEKEAAKLIVEMKEQQEEQVKLIEKQEKIVGELNKHIDKHNEENEEPGEGKGKEDDKKERKDGESTEKSAKNEELPDPEKPENAKRSVDVAGEVAKPKTPEKLPNEENVNVVEPQVVVEPKIVQTVVVQADQDVRKPVEVIQKPAEDIDIPGEHAKET